MLITKQTITGFIPHTDSFLKSLSFYLPNISPLVAAAGPAYGRSTETERTRWPTPLPESIANRTKQPTHGLSATDTYIRQHSPLLQIKYTRTEICGRFHPHLLHHSVELGRPLPSLTRSSAPRPCWGGRWPQRIKRKRGYDAGSKEQFTLYAG